ncbi:hypothetical protein EV424DRAFT_1573925 [Suillus variegatus]|nr:hypothetical protein EV424DRAFT_1573925 [Suillus variegatus]
MSATSSLAVISLFQQQAWMCCAECSSRTFQQSLALIQNLSHIPDTRDIIAQELKTKVQDCRHTILADLGNLVNALTSSRDDVLASSVAPKFSSPSSDQTKLLRVLKTIDYMYTPRVVGPVTDETRKSEDAEKVQTIYESFHFAPLWRCLGDCLSTIEEKPELEHMAIDQSRLGLVPFEQQHLLALQRLQSMEDLFMSFTDDLVAGFQEIIPNELITLFNELELELLISGTPDIDVDEWRAATEYSSYTSSDPVRDLETFCISACSV